MPNYNTVERWEINRLARLFYAIKGKEVESGYNFNESIHPEEKLCWILAEESYKFWRKNEKR